MRKTLEDLYYGNITPCEQDMTAGSELKRAVDRVAGANSSSPSGWAKLSR